MFFFFPTKRNPFYSFFSVAFMPSVQRYIYCIYIQGILEWNNERAGSCWSEEGNGGGRKIVIGDSYYTVYKRPLAVDA